MCVVLVDRLQTRDGHVVVEIALNVPKSLNALNREMIEKMLQVLDECRQDPTVVALVLHSTIEKAFCAGGDVVGLRSACLEGDVRDEATDFFQQEYKLDYAIHSFNKPIIGWGSGIVMGGGMGLLCGCSHRVVTETTLMAMPEITIGLYPDVGGSWFLNRAPGRTGLFLALTGARLNAADALFVGFADRLLHSTQREQLREQILHADWSGEAAAEVHRILKSLEEKAGITLESSVENHLDVVQSLTDHHTVEEVVESILAHDCGELVWLSRAQKSLLHGSPLAAQLIFRQLKVSKHLSLKEVFQCELILSVQCCLQREFFEGVRALLVDKDGRPSWRYGAVREVEQAVVDSCFEMPWSQHPLSDL